MTRSQTNKAASNVSDAVSCTKKRSYNTRSSTNNDSSSEPNIRTTLSEVKKTSEPSIIITRSQHKKMEQGLTVEIDFNEASRCWMKNKKRVGNGMYSYKK